MPSRPVPRQWRPARAGVTALALAGVVTLGGCTGGSSPTHGESTAGSTAIGAAPDRFTNNAVNEIGAAPRSQLRADGTMTWALAQPIANFNYFTPSGATTDAASILDALLPRPFHTDAAGAPSVDTDYFTSISATSARPLVVTYRVNPRARWSNGRPLSWIDLAAQWRALNGTSPARTSTQAGYDQIGSVTPGADGRSAVVTFTRPFTDWRSLFSPLEPAELTTTPTAFASAWAQRPTVTAGPFAWGASNPTAQTYTVVRDRRWWGDPAELDSITYAVYGNPQTAVQAIASHQVDYVDVSAGNAVANIAAARTYTGVQIRQAAGDDERQIILNTRDPLLADVAVRRAIVLGIDRARITTSLLGPLGGDPTPLQNHVFVKNQSAYTATCSTFCSYDPAAAQALLRADGWTLEDGFFTRNGHRLTVTITIPSGTADARAEATLAQASLRSAGIELTIAVVPSARFVADILYPAGGARFQLTSLTRVGTAFPVGDAVSAYSLSATSAGRNPGAGGSSAINALLATAASAPQGAAEDAAANAASAAMWPVAAWLPLYQRPQVTAVNAGLANLGAPGFADVVYQDIGYRR